MPGTGRSLDFSPPRPLAAAGRRIFDPAVFRPKRWASATPTSSPPTVRLLMQTPPAPARTPVAPQSSPGPPPGPVAGTFSVGLPCPHGPQQFILTRQRAECSSPNANQTVIPLPPPSSESHPKFSPLPRGLQPSAPLWLPRTSSPVSSFTALSLLPDPALGSTCSGRSLCPKSRPFAGSCCLVSSFGGVPDGSCTRRSPLLVPLRPLDLLLFLFLSLLVLAPGTI